MKLALEKTYRMEAYYYEQLNKSEQKIYQAIKKGLESMQQSFLVPQEEMVVLSDVFYKVRLDCPKLFFASNFKYSYYEDSTYVKMKPTYLFEKNKIIEHEKAINSRIEKLIRPMKEKTDLEKEQFIHDFICEHVTYDKLKKQYSHEIIGPLTQGVGVCEGIAKTVKVLCDQLYIPCIVVISNNNPEKNIKYRHAWNILKIDNTWYHLDVTFDNSLGKDNLRYDYFNLDDAHIFLDHEPLIYEVHACKNGENFYYKEKKLSFTKQQEVEKRIKQAVKKGKEFTFHWRGGYFTKAIMEEFLAIITNSAKEKKRHVQVSINPTQAIMHMKFKEELAQDMVQMQDAYEEENEAVSGES